ncbi:nardilysin-like, partial [Cryptotermes secundus]|uniref:nardilysin-like n=1 Tax=Cryptotermes secundus TaxID=105785 RepID=UPI001454BB59
MHLLTRAVKVLSKILPKPAICAFSRTSELFGSKMSRTIENAHEGEEGMRLVGAGGAEVKAESNVQYLPAPTKSQNDKKNYKVVCLENGLTALLISDVLQEGAECMEEDYNDYSSEEEGDHSSSDDSESDAMSCDDITEDDGRKKAAPKEEKLAALGLCVGVGSFSDPWSIQG